MIHFIIHSFLHKSHKINYLCKSSKMIHITCIVNLKDLNKIHRCITTHIIHHLIVNYLNTVYINLDQNHILHNSSHKPSIHLLKCIRLTHKRGKEFNQVLILKDKSNITMSLSKSHRLSHISNMNFSQNP